MKKTTTMSAFVLLAAVFCGCGNSNSGSGKASPDTRITLDTAVPPATDTSQPMKADTNKTDTIK